MLLDPTKYNVLPIKERCHVINDTEMLLSPCSIYCDAFKHVKVLVATAKIVFDLETRKEVFATVPSPSGVKHVHGLKSLAELL